jgi:putative membrane protein
LFTESKPQFEIEPSEEFPMSRILRIVLAVTFAAVLGICAATAEQATDKSNSSASSGATAQKESAGRTMADTRFMKAAAEGGLAEVALGQLAVEKASSSDVKKFGQRMVDDHSKANDQLKQLASQKKVDLPQGLSAKDKATKASLEKLSGEQFDQAYMKGMVKDHKKKTSANSGVKARPLRTRTSRSSPPRLCRHWKTI